MNESQIVNMDVVDVKDLNNEQINSITCPLCFGLVYKPVECEGCGRLFCESQARDWKMENNSCPNCRIKPWKIKVKIHRCYNIILNKVSIKCPCYQDLKYQQLQSHNFGGHLARQKQCSQQKLQTSGLSPIVNSKTAPKFIFYYNYDPWYVFDNKQNERINKKLQLGELQFIVLSEQKVQYTMDLSKLVMRSKLEEVKIKAVATEDSAVWRCRMQENMAWCAYPAPTNRRIELHYQKYMAKSMKQERIKVFVNGGQYEIDFKKMIQIKINTKFERPITRSEY